MQRGSKYEDRLDRYEPRYDETEEDGGAGSLEEEPAPRPLSRRQRRQKRKLEEKLRRLESREKGRDSEQEPGPEQEDAEEPRRRSRFTEGLMALLSGNILSRSEVSRTYPYLVFVAFLAFLYIGNIFSMQHLHRQHTILTREVRELRTKSMTIASQRMQATRQSNIVREIERRGLPLRESLTPNRVIPK